MRALLRSCVAIFITCLLGGVVMVCVTLIAKAGGALIARCFGMGEIVPTAVIFFCMLVVAGWAIDRFWPETISPGWL